MAREFLLPDPGEGIHEADILEIHVSPGDEVKDGDPLFSVETDKAVVDIPASFDGVIEEIHVGVGDLAEVGSLLLTFTETRSDSSEGARSGSVPGEDEQSAHSSTDRDPETDQKSEKETDQRSVKTKAEPISEDRTKGDRRPVPASPATRSLAKRLGVDLHQIRGSGPDGLIEPGDVQAAAREESVSHEDEAANVAPENEEVQWVELSGVRRATARHMTEAWQKIPHVTHHDIADITDLETLRREHAAELEDEGGRLSLTVFLVKAAAAALRDHPRFNASIDVEENRLALKSNINIGVAVDTADGLVVPVIDDANEKSIAEIAIELPAMAKRMRSGERSPEDMTGGTFTITNPGGIGGTSFEPIINHPEVAILGAARAREVPVIVGESKDDGTPELEARRHLPLVLAFDHRVNDGADAARFMNSIKGLLEDPGRLVLRI